MEARASRPGTDLAGVLKWVLTAALLLGLAWRLDLAEVGRALARLPLHALGAAVVLPLLSALLAAQRWRRVLAALGAPASLASLLGDVLVGRALNLVLPTQVGGDVARALRARRRLPRPGDAWATVLYERLIGLVVLAALPLAVCALAAHRLPSGLAGAAWLLLIAAGALLVALDPALAGLARLGTSLPRVGGAIARIRESLAVGLAGPRVAAEAAAWSLLSQLAALAPLWVAGAAWALPQLGAAIFVGVPLVLIASMLPITVGGFGLRESLFVAVLGLFGLPAEQALALSLIWLASLLPAAVSGLLVLALEQRGRVRQPS